MRTIWAGVLFLASYGGCGFDLTKGEQALTENQAECSSLTLALGDIY